MAGDADQAMRSASSAASQARQASSGVRYLDAELDRLEMVCEAMWELLKNKLGATDEELMSYIAELDLSDGSADGKVKRGVLTCSKCSRPNSRRHDFCIYCGEMIRTSPFQ
jgi:hypothetical protein